MKRKDSISAFFELLRGGLWEKPVNLSLLGSIDFGEIYNLAEEQAVVGLVAAGLEHVKDERVTKKDVLKFIGQTLQLEQRNVAMNYFIGVIVEKMRDAGISTLLVKGQGVAQCYERPLWRSSGDVDFYLDAVNYDKAKHFLKPLASFAQGEDAYRKHLGMSIDPWMVELHGTMHTGISWRINHVLDQIHNDVFLRNGTRIWMNDGVEVYLPNPDNDVIIIFTHFIDHFYVGGVGVRQISDWIRLLYYYRNDIHISLLDKRIRDLGLIEEWKSFAAFAVEYLGMEAGAMPFYMRSKKYQRKARRISCLIIETGNFGHNKEDGYRTKMPKIESLFVTFYRRLLEFIRIATIFPTHAPKFFLTYVYYRFRIVLK